MIWMAARTIYVSIFISAYMQDSLIDRKALSLQDAPHIPALLYVHNQLTVRTLCLYTHTFDIELILTYCSCLMPFSDSQIGEMFLLCYFSAQ